MAFLAAYLMIFALCNVKGMEYSSMDIIISPDNLTTSIGSTVFFSCVITTDGAAAAVNVTWKHYGYDLVPTPSINISETILNRNGHTFIKSILEICVTEVDFAGDYSCVATSMSNKTSLEENFRLDVENPYHIPVHIIVAPSDDQKLERKEAVSQAMTILCVATGLPHPRIQWQQNGRPLVNSTVHHIHERTQTRGKVDLVVGTLEICDFKSSNVGNYTCEALNEFTSVQTHFHLSIPVPVSLVTAPSPFVNRTIGKIHEISCDFHAYPPPTVTWTFNEVPIRPIRASSFTTNQTEIMGPREQTLTRSFLSITTFTTQLSGEYACIGKNEHSAVTHSFYFNVQVPVGIISAPVNSDYDENSTVILSCTAYGIPQPTVTWKKNGQALLSPTPRTSGEVLHGMPVIKSFLELCPLQQELSSDQYSCEVSNGVNSLDGVPARSASFDVCFRETFGLLVAPMDSEIVAGEAIYLPCAAFSTNGREVHVTWRDSDGILLTNSSKMEVHEQKHIKDGVYITRSVLQIGCTSPDEYKSGDAMYYSCVATDGIERSQAEITLTYAVPTTSATTNIRDPVSTDGLISKGIGYASYVGGAVCILPLIAVIIIHLISSASWSWPVAVCTTFSSLFHLFFLAASFSISNLIFLRLRTSGKGVYATAIVLNWVLPLLVLIVSLTPAIQNYMVFSLCIPVEWSLWLGLLLPFAAVHLVSWMVLLLSPVLRHCAAAQSSSAWHKETIAIGFILFFFNLAWEVEFPALVLPPGSSTAVTLKSIFIASSISLGFITLVYFCFLKPQARSALQDLFHCNCNKISPEHDIDIPQALVHVTSDNNFEVIPVPLPQSFVEQSQMISKLADL